MSYLVAHGFLCPKKVVSGFIYLVLFYFIFAVVQLSFRDSFRFVFALNADFVSVLDLTDDDTGGVESSPVLPC